MAKKSQQIVASNIRETLGEVSQWAVLAFLAIFPLLPGTQYVYVNITISKFIYFLAFLGVYIAAVIVIFGKWDTHRRQLLVNSKSSKEVLTVETAKWKPSIPQILAVVYMLWSFISACISRYSWEDKLIGQSRYEGLIAIVAYGVLFLLVSEFAEHDKVFIYGLAIMGTVMGVIATIQCFGSKILYPGDYNYFNSSFLATIGHEDCFSGFISMIIPALVCAYVLADLKNDWIILISVGLLLYPQLFSDVDSGKIGLLAAFVVAMPFIFDTKAHIEKSLKAFAIMCLAFGFYGLFKNTTVDKVSVTPGKTFMLGIIAAIVLFSAGILVSKKEIKVPSVKTLRIAIVVLIVIAIIVALIFVYTYKGDKNLLVEASQLLHGELTDQMGTLRGYIWKATFKIIQKNPIAGSGPGTFKSEFEPFNAGYDEINWHLGHIVDFAHNDYLQIAACQGIVGLIIYLSFIGILFIRGVKSSLNNSLGLIYLVAVVGFLAHTLFGFSIAIISPVYWVLAGLLESLCRCSIVSENEN